MSIIELIFIGLSLAMDACAVSMIYGMMPSLFLYQRLFITSYFGFFQAMMTFIGYHLGCLFADKIAKIDHYVAFILLFILGLNMIKESFEQDSQNQFIIEWKSLTLLAVATSIDALAIGVTFAFLEVHLYLSVVLIGLTTFLVCIMGSYVGTFIGKRFQNHAVFLGGIILIILSFKVLIDHFFA